MNGPGQGLKLTRILFMSIVAGMTLFMLVAVIITQANGALLPELNGYHTLLSAGIIIIAFACSLLAKYLFGKGLRDAKNSLNPLPGKLNRYRASLITYLAISEVPVLLSIVVFLLTGNFVFEVYAGVFLGFILVMYPSRKKVIGQLELDGQAQLELE